jgi:hypothetical protein
MKSVVNPLENLDANAMARNVLGSLNVDFPGRRKWEEDLSARKNALVAALQRASVAYESFYRLRDVLKNVSVPSRGDEEKLVAARSAAQQAIGRAQSEEAAFKGTMETGRQRAMEWTRK